MRVQITFPDGEVHMYDATTVRISTLEPVQMQAVDYGIEIDELPTQPTGEQHGRT